jgi:transcriptional regulator with XRE-family HTH domain
MGVINKLKEVRVKRGIKQKELADYLNIKINTYSQYENGVRKPSADVISKLSKFYGILSDELLSESDDQEKYIDDFYVLRALSGTYFSLVLEANLKFAELKILLVNTVESERADDIELQMCSSELSTLIKNIRNVEELMKDFSEIDEIENFLLTNLGIVINESHYEI